MPRPDPGNRHVLEVLRAWTCGTPVPAPPDGDDWLDAAQEHGVLAVVGALHEAAGHAVPPDVPRELARARAHQLRVLTDLARVGSALDGAGIRWLVLKGPALAWQAYPPSVPRPSADLDVLVAPRDFEAAVGVLRAGGARERDEPWREKLARRHAEVSLDLDGGLHLDLHWHAVATGAWRRRTALPTPALLDRRAHADLGGVTAPVPDPLDAVAHVAVHACASGADRLRWLLDLSRLLRTVAPDPDVLADHARRTRTQVPLWLLLERTARYLDPGLRDWRRAVDVPPAWRLAGTVWSRRFPPGAALSGSSSGTALYLDAGRGLPRALGRALRSAVRRSDVGNDEGLPGTGETLRARYYEYVASEAGQ